MLRYMFTAAFFIPLSFGTVRAQVPASAAQSAAYAYSIQYVPSDRGVKHGFFKVDSYDRISQNLEERISKLLQERGLHLVKPSDPAAFKVTVELLKAKGSDAMSNPLRTFGTAGVFLTADVSIADGTGNQVFTHEYRAKGLVHAYETKRADVLATAAADDLARQLDNDDSFNEVLNARSRIPSRVAEQATPAAANAPAAPKEVSPSVAGSVVSPASLLLPAGTPVIVAFSDEVLLPLTAAGERSKKNAQNLQSGDPVSLVLAEDIRVGDAVVVKAGSKVAGNVFERPIPKGEQFGEGAIWGLKGAAVGGERRGPLRIRVTYLVIGDREVPFRGGEAHEKDSIVPGAEILGKVRKVKHSTLLPAPFPRKVSLSGEFADIDAGTRVKVFTAEDVSLPALPQRGDN